MGDSISTSASIVAILQLTKTVVKYINDVKGASEDRKKILLEISTVNGLLFSLQDLVERPPSDDSWVTTCSEWPASTIQVGIGATGSKVGPSYRDKEGWKGTELAIQKGDVTGILHMIERQKSLFVLALQEDNIELSKGIRGDVREAAEGVAEIRNRILTQESRDIFTWLSPLNFWSKQNDVFRIRLEGIGEWLLKDAEFKGWLAGSQEILLCSGMHFLDRTFQSEDIGVAYLYCSYKEQQEQTTLAQRRSVISEGLKSLYDSHIEKKTRPTLGECSKLLLSEVGRFSKTFIIDALDECTEYDGMRSTLIKEVRKLQLKANLLVTSRDIVNIEREFEGERRLEIWARNGDIQRYLKSRIADSPRLLCHIKADPCLEETIVTAIVGKSQGMFLLAQLDMDSLANKQNRREIRRAIDNLPKGLDDTYDDAMQRIESQVEDDAKLANRVLSWISFAFRSLTIMEIQHALAIEPEDADIDVEALPDEDLLVSVCAGLVTIDQKSSVVRLVHYTTQEYFRRVRATRFPYAQISIATTCLLYISIDAFAEGYCHSDQEMEARLYDYPLLEYAAQHWGDHARGGSDETIKGLALRFPEHTSKLMCSNQVMRLSGYRYSGYSQKFPKGIIGLHIAASFGLVGIAELLLACEDVDADSKDKSGQTPLSWAAENGHGDMVRLLLARIGVDADSKDKSLLLWKTLTPGTV
ncbi:hypothetical protein FGG08_006595 [Glutinoglossum americanum]|uniref:Uncharacterized protein n=1 Tax=Glutinoglossum americanum TaxID=1670608 RepID=A0A9P8L1R7_9PEZI|nr:hypothetical protein FGG08_006595 [Glutinoglossum americanum]